MVQVYVRDLVSSVVTPVRQLKAFSKVSLESGEVAELTLEIPVSELMLTDENGLRFLEPGAFRLEVGSASDDIRSELEIEVGE